jgi:RNA polymerase sigma-70 factor (ECF subfamily)
MTNRPNHDPNHRFERLVWPCLQTLLRVARHMCRNDHEAEDLVQETMLKALRSMHQFDHGQDARPWLLTIQRNLFIDRCRAAERRPPTVPLNESLDGPANDLSCADAGRFDARWAHPEQLLERFDNPDMVAALKLLPVEIRWTLLLVDVEQLDHAQAAQVLGVPVGTIKSRAHRGRQMLRDRLFQLALQRGWVHPPSEDSP